ncbi:fimbrial protein FimV, partial [Ramlibacter aquaticus]|nr:fimbrial protein FimV [Ramlibacter aquaticus]
MAAALLLGFSTSPAFALGLGRVTVKSALGEPLRAEVDITDITPDELASLRTDVATPDTFRAHGLDYNPALGTVTITLERRPDGRPLLVLRSPRAVNDPFIDLVLETSWTGGRITRDYTLLFDPPSQRPAQPLQAQA